MRTRDDAYATTQEAGSVVPPLGHRTDIQVLRGVAVLLVLAYHAAAPGFAAGFVGVDMFFVVSGYLITRLLAAEHARSGSIDLRGFFARRARRLLPAGALVGIATAGVWLLVTTSVERTRQAAAAVGAALFHANIALANIGRDYLGSGGAELPWEHWWSLGVEEQFYVLWPLLLLGLLTWRGLAGRGTIAVVAALAFLSLASSVVVTPSDPAGAYFLLQSRAWQLLGGGLLALAELRGLAPGTRTRRTLLALGGLGIVATLVAVDGRTAYPGAIAMLPTGATLALVAGGIGTGRRERRPPAHAPGRALVWVGDRSYSLYLWHWPALVLLARVAGGASARVEDLSAAGRVGALLTSLLLCHLTFQLVEEPVRRAAWLRREAGATGVGGVALVTGFAAVIALATTAPPAPAAAGVGLAEDTLLRQQLPAPVDNTMLLRPPPSEAFEDLFRPRICVSVNADPDPAPLDECEIGEDRGGELVVAWGDSHIEMWRPALDEWARQSGRHGFLLWKSACSPFDIPPMGLDGEYFENCERWRETAREQLRELDPDVLVVAGATTGASFPVSDEEWVRAIPAAIGQLHELVPDARIVLLGDVPVIPDVPVCVEEFGTDAAQCEGTVLEVIREAEQRTAADRDHVTYVDTTRWLCRSSCPVVIGNVLVYRDDNHVTNTFAPLYGAVLLEELG